MRRSELAGGLGSPCCYAGTRSTRSKKHPERHRNWLIHMAQGNRNPFIDQPKVASEALLKLGFGKD